MSEAELAEYYYEHRDDPDFLGEEVPQAGSNRLSSMVSVRFPPEEAVRVRRAAEEAGMTLSSYLRHCALTFSDRPVDIDRVRRDVEEAGRRLDDALSVLHIRQAG
ncbi:plasmid mobilization protein [Sphaerisporangium dianthi]|uniref:CopG family transcriptional regulator n=1 Tax=Sphaerisporangium dianthi TaxID=1436120 RepID=A0ABV9CI83_9ACTN